MTGPIRRRPNPSRSELGTETPSEKMGGRLHPHPRARRVFGAVDLSGGRTRGFIRGKTNFQTEWLLLLKRAVLWDW